MGEETFVFSLENSIPVETLKFLERFSPVVVDHGLELTISREHDLNSAFATLSQAGIAVLTMRNKTNRLEEFFVQKTQNKKEKQTV